MKAGGFLLLAGLLVVAWIALSGDQDQSGRAPQRADGPEPEHAPVLLGTPGADESTDPSAPVDGGTQIEESSSAPAEESHAGSGRAAVPNVSTTLVVTDAETGRAIPNARALRSVHLWTSPAGRKTPRLDTLRHSMFTRGDEVGVIKLPASNRVHDWWVIATGYRSVLVRAAPDVKRRQVPLGPGGSIRVDVIGAEVQDPFLVFAVQPHWNGDMDGNVSPLQRRPSPENQYVVEGMAPGASKVILGSPGVFSIHEVWASTDVTVVAGEVTTVELVIPDRTPSVRHAITGTIAVHADWSPSSSRIQLAASYGQGFSIAKSHVANDLDPAKPWRFDFDELPKGSYTLSIPSIDFEVAVEVPADGPLHFSVLPPVTFRVMVLDDKSGKPIGEDASASVHFRSDGKEWEQVESDDTSGWWWRYYGQSWAYASPKVPDKPCVVTIPGMGEAMVEVEAPGYVPYRYRATVARGSDPATKTVRLQRAPLLRVRIVKAGTVVQSALGTCSVAREASGGEAESQVVGGINKGQWKFDDLPPGRYRIRWSQSKQERFAQLRAGETTVIDFEMP